MSSSKSDTITNLSSHSVISNWQVFWLTLIHEAFPTAELSVATDIQEIINEFTAAGLFETCTRFPFHSQTINRVVKPITAANVPLFFISPKLTSFLICLNIEALLPDIAFHARTLYTSFLFTKHLLPIRSLSSFDALLSSKHFTIFFKHFEK